MPRQSSMPFGDRRVFAARMENLSETAAFVDGFCARHGIGRGDALRLALVIEELFANTIAHGYRGDTDAPIVVALARGDGAVAIAYEDAAPRFDPLSQPPANLTAPLETRPVGGLGIALVRRFADTMRYAREDGLNRVWLTVRCTSLAPSERAIAQP